MPLAAVKKHTQVTICDAGRQKYTAGHAEYANGTTAAVMISVSLTENVPYKQQIPRTALWDPIVLSAITTALNEYSTLLNIAYIKQICNLN